MKYVIMALIGIAVILFFAYEVRGLIRDIKKRRQSKTAQSEEAGEEKEDDQK